MTRTAVAANHYEELGALRTRMDTVESTLEAHGSKLDTILSRISNNRPFDPLGVLKFIALSIAVVGSLATAITYVATSTYSGEIAVLRFKTDEIWKSGHWQSNVLTVQKNVQ